MYNLDCGRKYTVAANLLINFITYGKYIITNGRQLDHIYFRLRIEIRLVRFKMCAQSNFSS